MKEIRDFLPNKKREEISFKNQIKKEIKMSLTTCDNYINGAYAAPSSGEYMDVYNPSTGKKIGKVAISNQDDVNQAVTIANNVYHEKWSKLTTKNRVQYLLKLNYLIKKHEDELADLIVLEHGKNKMEALGDVRKGNETVEYACGMPALIRGNVEQVSGGVECKDVRIIESLGVVTSIVPFNFPAMVPMWTIPIALAVGNCVILKPSEKVPLTTNRIIQLYKEAGFPDGVIQVIHGTRVAVESLIDHTLIKAVSFVGSSKVANIVFQRCSQLNKRVLALGGAKNHLISAPDCNIEMTAQDVVNSYTGCTGQRCMAASVLLLIGEQQELLDLIISKSKSLIPGKNIRNIGPVIDQFSLDRITNYINTTNGKLLLDGRNWTNDHKDGYWVGPTVILHDNINDKELHDEIFGPVLSVYICKNKEEAIQIENNNAYGNAACIYTCSGATSEWFTSRLHKAGMIGVNIGVPVPREPFSFGGWNKSKFTNSDITGDGGIEFFTQRKNNN